MVILHSDFDVFFRSRATTQSGQKQVECALKHFLDLRMLYTLRKLVVVSMPADTDALEDFYTVHLDSWPVYEENSLDCQYRCLQQFEGI